MDPPHEEGPDQSLRHVVGNCGSVHRPGSATCVSANRDWVTEVVAEVLIAAHLDSRRCGCKARCKVTWAEPNVARPKVPASQRTVKPVELSLKIAESDET